MWSNRTSHAAIVPAQVALAGPRGRPGGGEGQHIGPGAAPHRYGLRYLGATLETVRGNGSMRQRGSSGGGELRLQPSPSNHALSIFFIRAHFKIALWAVHVPGVQNTWADAISRDNLGHLFSQVPGAVTGQCQVPSQLVQLLVVQRPDWTPRTWTQLFRSCLQPE